MGTVLLARKAAAICDCVIGCMLQLLTWQLRAPVLQVSGELTAPHAVLSAHSKNLRAVPVREKCVRSKIVCSGSHCQRRGMYLPIMLPYWLFSLKMHVNQDPRVIPKKSIREKTDQVHAPSEVCTAVRQLHPLFNGPLISRNRVLTAKPFYLSSHLFMKA